VRRCRTRDALCTVMPGWTPFMVSMMNTSLLNTHRNGGIELTSMEQPHSYGPSLRALWADAKRLGKSDPDARPHIVAWARDRPACWDRRADQQQAQPLAQRLAATIAWRQTSNLEYPWAAEIAGAQWRIRVNDFPDDLMYSLWIEGMSVGDFHDWPTTW